MAAATRNIGLGKMQAKILPEKGKGYTHAGEGLHTAHLPLQSGNPLGQLGKKWGGENIVLLPYLLRNNPLSSSKFIWEYSLSARNFSFKMFYILVLDRNLLSLVLSTLIFVTTEIENET